ncbi:MAG: tetratricopeptide repeat protein, partial [Chthoniobacteraceae bacterium]
MSPRLDVATTAQTAAFLLVAILQCAIPVASGATEQAAPAETVRKADPFATGTDEATIRLELARAEVAYGKDAPGVAALLRELSESLVNFERFAATEPHKRSARIAEAESLIRRALALDESNAGRGHPDVAHDLHILTRLLLLEWSVRNKFDRYAEAEAFARRALAIDDARSDDKDRDVARDLLTLENVLVAKQRWAEAEPLVRRALLIIEGLSGKAHPDTFPARNNLAQILTFLRRYEEAEELYKAALAHAEAACGKDQDSIATHLRNIIRCHSQTKRMADAEPFIRRIVAIDENAHDKNDRQYANDLRSLADSVIAAGRPLDAGQI